MIRARSGIDIVRFKIENVGFQHFLPLLLLSGACSGEIDEEATIAWALNYADVTVGETSITGTHTWSFYKEGWESSRDLDALACSVVQAIEGESTDIEGCVAAYTISLSTLDSDCPEGVTNDPMLTERITSFCVDALSDDASAQSPWPDESMGWSLVIGKGKNSIEHGYVYATSLEQGDQAPDGWQVGENYLFWPTWAWTL